MEPCGTPKVKGAAGEEQLLPRHIERAAKPHQLASSKFPPSNYGALHLIARVWPSHVTKESQYNFNMEPGSITHDL